ncbi:alpha-L-fucosidase [Sphingomonas sp. BK481]|uniref:alpha-L-fucosidase n=1 Tax=Sphingomonas sp. BK481 TaxID=2586981 RepID=UPI0017AABBA9|nr:alpha-L-fucosidase [Sphingomonas sp. BK481]MBB3585898.1 alpha-L-fucosidase [Sphingomonas sp. BK481]
MIRATRRELLAGSTLAAFGTALPLAARAQSPAVTRPDLFIGTGGHGHTFPGATLPFGMVQLSPDTNNHGWDAWPSKFTKHSIASIPYKNGKGDIVGELAAACRRQGLKFGIYLSPWDRNHPDYGRPEYITFFRNQLRELLTQYGPIYEVFFDGANGGDGYYGGAREVRKIDAVPYYDWPSIIAFVHALQPMACTFDPVGADLRWVGNEEGEAGDPCWATMDDKGFTEEKGNAGVRGGAI